MFSPNQPRVATLQVGLAPDGTSLTRSPTRSAKRHSPGAALLELSRMMFGDHQLQSPPTARSMEKSAFPRLFLGELYLL